MTSGNWPALAWGPGDWAEAVVEETIRVRRELREPDLDTPQWEWSTEVTEVWTSEYFAPKWRAENTEVRDNWNYYDYQYQYMRDTGGLTRPVIRSGGQHSRM